MGKIGTWIVDKYRGLRKKCGKPAIPALRLQQLKKLHPSEDPEALSRKQDARTAMALLLILFAGAFLFAAVLTGAKREPVSSVERPGYGDGSESLLLEARRENADPVEVELSIGARALTEEQTEELLQEAEIQLVEAMKGDNESLDRVEGPLVLLEQAAGGLVEAEWLSRNRELLDDWGQILKSPEEIDPAGEEGSYLLTLSCGEKSRSHEISLRVFPPEMTKEEAFSEGLKAEAERVLAEDSQGQEAVLPSEYQGERLVWYQPEEEGGPYWILLLTALLALWVRARAEGKRKEALKERERQLLLDYPELVSKFTVLLQAGLSARNVWERMVAEYEKQRGKGEKPRYVMEEMRVTKLQLDNGVYESRAYGEFGRRCGLHPYMKFAALLEQSLRQGSGGLSLLLMEEAEAAFEQRKHLARRLGEEAATKLMLPMFLMLLVVLAVVMAPGFLSF